MLKFHVVYIYIFSLTPLFMTYEPINYRFNDVVFYQINETFFHKPTRFFVLILNLKRVNFHSSMKICYKLYEFIYEVCISSISFHVLRVWNNLCTQGRKCFGFTNWKLLIIWLKFNLAWLDLFCVLHLISVLICLSANNIFHSLIDLIGQ